MRQQGADRVSQGAKMARTREGSTGHFGALGLARPANVRAGTGCTPLLLCLTTQGPTRPAGGADERGAPGRTLASPVPAPQQFPRTPGCTEAGLAHASQTVLPQRRINKAGLPRNCSVLRSLNQADPRLLGPRRYSPESARGCRGDPRTETARPKYRDGRFRSSAPRFWGLHSFLRAAGVVGRCEAAAVCICCSPGLYAEPSG